MEGGWHGSSVRKEVDLVTYGFSWFRAGLSASGKVNFMSFKRNFELFTFWSTWHIEAFKDCMFSIG